jgi:ferric-dicitrate binding protein FerR (iron transport regulator)
MSRSTILREDLELDQLREETEELARREREFAENRRRLAEERSERERTIPPLEEIQVRMERIRHEQNVTRGEIANVRRDQNRSLALLVLLLAATGTLIWWGLRVMQGG